MSLMEGEDCTVVTIVGLPENVYDYGIRVSVYDNEGPLEDREVEICRDLSASMDLQLPRFTYTELIAALSRDHAGLKGVLVQGHREYLKMEPIK